MQLVKVIRNLKVFIFLYLSGILYSHLICSDYIVDKVVIVSNYKTR